MKELNKLLADALAEAKESGRKDMLEEITTLLASEPTWIDPAVIRFIISHFSNQ